MSEHDEAGRAVTFPPLPPSPPPPQPAARNASTAVRPISAVSENLLLTLPPRSPIAVKSPHALGARAASRQVSRQRARICNPEPERQAEERRGSRSLGKDFRDLGLRHP